MKKHPTWTHTGYYLLDTNLSVDEHFKYTSPCKINGILILHMSCSVPWVVFDGGLRFIIWTDTTFHLCDEFFARWNEQSKPDISTENLCVITVKTQQRFHSIVFTSQELLGLWMHDDKHGDPEITVSKSWN